MTYSLSGQISIVAFAPPGFPGVEICTGSPECASLKTEENFCGKIVL